MANKRDLRLAVADTMLTGVGLEIAILQVEALIKAERSKASPDDDRLESLYGHRKQLRSLAEKQGENG